MNVDNLHTIFANYIRKFDIINDAAHDENYKWRLAALFPELMNPDGSDFVAGMKKVASKDLSYNLINSRWQYPLTALIKCAETDESAVRDLFRALFADDGGSLIFRQKKIDAFNAGANALIAKTYPDHKNISQLLNTQRSAMSYLFFNDPEHHYLYKYTEVTEFAKAVEFNDDMGYGAGFKMDVFYRMCDELAEEIRKCDLLVKTTRRRYFNPDGTPVEAKTMYRDENYHILAFDIIWGTGVTDHPDYNFGEGIPWLSADNSTAHSEEMENITPPPRIPITVNLQKAEIRGNETDTGTQYRVYPANDRSRRREFFPRRRLIVICRKQEGCLRERRP